MRKGAVIAASLAIAVSSVVSGHAVAATSAEQHVGSERKPAVTGPERELLSLEEMKSRPHGPHSAVVLEFLTIMDRVVNKDKQPLITTADWAPLGQLVDQDKFRRVGNFGVKNDWPSYVELLTQWSRSNWWKGYIWRMREVPGSAGQPSLVYLETEERSNQKHPVREDGDYRTLASIAVYEIDANNKIVGLHVYDQRPL